MIMQQIKTFEVDEKIAPHIEKLNNKGYITEFSCSGHPERSMLGYITFDVCTSIDIEENNIGTPHGWFCCNEYDDDKRYSIYMEDLDEDNYKSVVITDEYIDHKLELLDQWIDSLPVNKTCCCEVQTVIVEESLI